MIDFKQKAREFIIRRNQYIYKTESENTHAAISIGEMAEFAEEIILEAKNDRKFRWTLYKILDEFESQQSMREILKKRFG